MRRSAVRSRSWPMSLSGRTTTTAATISISESSPKPARATERALAAATPMTIAPTTFHPSVRYSR